MHDRIVNPVEKELLVQILHQTAGVQKTAAQRLGMNRNTLYKKLKDYGLDKGSARARRLTNFCCSASNQAG